jgi:hypothetical protein
MCSLSMHAFRHENSCVSRPPFGLLWLLVHIAAHTRARIGAVMHTSCPFMGWDLRRRNQVDAHVRLTPRRQPQSRCPRTPSVIITDICVLTYDPTESVHASRMAKTTLQQPTPTACMCVCTCTTTLFLPLLGPLICSFRPRALKPTLEPSTTAILPPCRLQCQYL